MTRIAIIANITVLLLLPLFSCSSPDTSVPQALHQSVFGEGNHSISGSVDLPAGTASGRFVQLILERTGTSPFTETSSAGFTTDSDRIDFAIEGLTDGTYLIRLQVDATDNTRFGESGDIEGYTGGTVSSPVFAAADAARITINGESVEGVAFGTGIIP